MYFHIYSFVFVICIHEKYIVLYKIQEIFSTHRIVYFTSYIFVFSAQFTIVCFKIFELCSWFLGEVVKVTVFNKV